MKIIRRKRYLMEKEGINYILRTLILAHEKARINREKLSFTQSIRTMYFNLNATYTLPVKIRTINKYFPHGNNITYQRKE